MIITFLKLILCFVSTQAVFAAPFPATSSSTFLGVSHGLFTSPEGFSIHADKTDWILTEAPENPHIITIFKAPYLSDGVQPSLTVRVDQLEKSAQIGDYLKKWLKEYPRLGFNVLASRKLEINGQSGILLDLTNLKSQKQLRQVIFFNPVKDQAVVLTCRDSKKGFAQSLRDCNQLIKNFSWSNSVKKKAA